MKWSFIITLLASAVFAGASMRDVQPNQRTNDDQGDGLVNTQDGLSQESASFVHHRVLQQDSQRQQRNQNPNRNRDRDRNRQPNNREQDGSRNRNRQGVCTPFGSQCDPNQSNCCQGGCNLSTHQCFCQENGGLCFNKGGDDNFCCSNKCGDDGLCSCIAEGESCAVGETFCCGGLMCREGQCVQALAESTEFPTPFSVPRPTLKPTPQPTEPPTPLPTPLPSPNPTPLPTFQCRGIGGACFGFNHICCSGVCGEDETCQNSCVRLGQSCYGVNQFCCSGLCGEDGVCIRMTSEPTREPTAPPSPLPSKAPTDLPTVLPTPRPSNPPSNPPTPKPSNPPTPRPSEPPTPLPSKPPTNPPTPMPSNLSTPKPSKSPTLPPTRPPTNFPTPDPSTSPTMNPTISLETLRQQLREKGHSVFEPRSTNGCKNGKYKIKVEIMTDKFGGDTAWSLIKDSSGDVIYSVPEKTYDKNSLEAVEICVRGGEHTFKISDNYGDGVCCQQGDGYIKVYLEEREILHITQQFKNLSLKINVGYDPTLKMTERDFLYLEAHNRRREIWHEGYKKPYEPLIWSNELAEASRLWAEEALVNCSIAGIEHDKKNPYGENLAENKGERRTWGQLYPPDLIVGRWIDREVGLPYPSNAHLTAALWRGSKYVGCGEAEKDWGRERGGGSGKCRVQVCRYARTCNCGMGNFKNGEDWLIPMLADTSKCGPDCPPEGCY